MNELINNLLNNLLQNKEFTLNLALIFCGVGGVGLVVAMVWISVTGNWGRVAIPLAISLLFLAGVAAGVAFLLDNFNILLIVGLVIIVVFIFLIWRVYSHFSGIMEEERDFKERFNEILDYDDPVKIISELTMLSKTDEVEENSRRHEMVINALKRVRREHRI